MAERKGSLIIWALIAHKRTLTGWSSSEGWTRVYLSDLTNLAG